MSDFGVKYPTILSRKCYRRGDGEVQIDGIEEGYVVLVELERICSLITCSTKLLDLTVTGKVKTDGPLSIIIKVDLSS